MRQQIITALNNALRDSDCFVFPSGIKVQRLEGNMRLSPDDSIIKLFKFYNGKTGENVEEYLPIENTEHLLRILKDRSASAPEGFIPFFEKIVVSDDIPNTWAAAIMDGVISHLVRRFGNSDPPKSWRPRTPLPDAVTLAKVILNYLEAYPFLWEECDEIADVLKVCSCILDNPGEIEPLIFCQFRLASHQDPEKPEDDDTLTKKDLEHISRHSVRGKTGEGIILLASNLLRKEDWLHPLIFPLLFRFATDPHPGVRVSILTHLTDFGQYDPEGAWKLYRSIFQTPHSLLWGYGEPFLCDQSNRYFKNVKHYLERIRKEAFDIAAKTWGKVSTVACLFGHIQEKALFKEIVTLNNKDVWQGLSEAFEERITESDDRDMTLLTADKFIPLINELKDFCSVKWFYDWLTALSETSPFSAIQLYEKLLAGADDAELAAKIIALRESLDM